MLFFLDVINVQSVTILNISGLYRHTHNPQKNDAHGPTSIKKDALHQSVCCRHIQPSGRQWWCPSWGNCQLDLIFINARVKTNGAHYGDMLLTQKLLTAMRKICVVFFIFQQYNALTAAHRKCETINFLERQTPAFILSDPISTQQYRSEAT